MRNFTVDRWIVAICDSPEGGMSDMVLVVAVHGNDDFIDLRIVCFDHHGDSFRVSSGSWDSQRVDILLNSGFYHMQLLYILSIYKLQMS